MNNTPKYIKAKAGVRYWEDAMINKVEDTKGDLVPFRKNDYWEPIINLETGQILDWPPETTANIHYKVCDDGEYWLLDSNKDVVAKWKGYYVPDLLCVDDEGFGDYIIFNVGEDGNIINWKEPKINDEHWK